MTDKSQIFPPSVTSHELNSSSLTFQLSQSNLHKAENSPLIAASAFLACREGKTLRILGLKATLLP